ncbi:unnamed protein product [Heligmosomoides polygyrus]|uniref:MFS domain-containing protein n=1 Tax=Heligmosomoides polygyrus TaxID=6339 RepID=A0A183G997_HELPZ|nr:unnamed protein product [Heligmosomoides polygyrus]
MAICPVLSALIFNSIFDATIGWWPGFAFFVGGILQLLVVAGQGGIHFLMRPQWLVEKRLKAQISAHSLNGEDCTQVDQQVVEDDEPELEEQHQETIAF